MGDDASGDIRNSGYREYLRSPHWKEFRQRYRESDLPQRCLGCKDPAYELHHVDYSRLGCEELTDVIPLCRGCHQRVHDYADRRRMGVKETGKILRRLFGWRAEKAAKRPSPSRKSGPGKPRRPRYGPKVKKVVPRNDLIAITRQIAVNLGWEEPKVYTPTRLGERREEIVPPLA